jgi:hypothetical protein
MKISMTDQKLIRDAVELGKTNFIEYYSGKDNSEEELSRAWHNLKTTPFARTISGKSNTRYEASEKELKVINKEIKEEYGEDHNWAKMEKEEKVKESKVSRVDQIKALYEGGMTKAGDIAKEIGANPSYVSTLLRKMKNKVSPE